MRVYQLYASVTASADNAANLSIAKKGKIINVFWQVLPVGAVADADSIRCELSLASSSQIGTNDPTSVVSGCGAAARFVTSGGAAVNINSSHDCQCGVEAGQKIYLHVNEAGTSTWAIRVFITVL